MQQLSPLDASFLYLESAGQYMHVAGLSLYDPSSVPPEKKRRQQVLGHKDIMNEFEKALHLIPHMRRKLAFVPGNLDHPWWVEDRDFDIEFHLRHIALPRPGDWRQLCIQVARLHSRPMDQTRPLWESYIIENLDNIPGLPPGSFATFNKVHHAAIDGATGAVQTMALHTLQPEDELPTATDSWRPEADPTGGELLARAWFNSVTAPVQAARIVGRALSSLQSAGGVNLGQVQQSIRSPRTLFNGRISPHRVFDARVFSLDSLRAIKKAHEGAKLNDVVTTIIAGALRSYLLGRRNLPAESMSAFMPINTRTAEERESGGNVVSGMTAQIGTHIADPKERLKYVCEQTAKAKEMVSAVGARNMMELGSLTPPLAMSLGTRALTQSNWYQYFPPPSNVVITNVPGSPVPLYSTGARLIATFGLGPNMHGQGMFFCIQSHTNIVSISFNACRLMVPDPEALAEAIRKSQEDLMRAVLGRVEVNVADAAAAALLTTTATRAEQKKTPRKAGKKTGNPAAQPVAAPGNGNGTHTQPAAISGSGSG